MSCVGTVEPVLKTYASQIKTLSKYIVAFVHCST